VEYTSSVISVDGHYWYPAQPDLSRGFIHGIIPVLRHKMAEVGALLRQDLKLLLYVFSFKLKSIISEFSLDSILSLFWPGIWIRGKKKGQKSLFCCITIPLFYLKWAAGI